ncbi:MAG: C10 family peptidase [Anaerolineae bacterium]|nr:C10 family peptidase [Anaerolineae bacterium]
MNHQSQIPKRLFGILVVMGLLCAFLASPVHAEPVPEPDVRAAVETWVRKVTAERRPDATVSRMEPYRVDGEIAAYIAHLAGGGFCLAGADTLALPVTLYSPEDDFDPENPDLQYLLWEIASETGYLRAGLSAGNAEVMAFRPQLETREAAWQNLIAGEIPVPDRQPDVSISAPTSMTLPLTSRWSQGSPFNDQCPVLTPSTDEHVVVGCVATAMAQIMYYWQWPNSGEGSDDVDYDFRFRTNWDRELLSTNPGLPSDSFWTGRLLWTTQDGGSLWMTGYWDETIYEQAQTFSANANYQSALTTLWNRLTSSSSNHSVNFSSASYDWELMADTHSDPVGPGDIEVARLSHHAGVAVHMNYGYYESGATGNYLDNAMEDHFRYDTDARDDSRDTARIIEDIQWLRPVALGGYTATLQSEIEGYAGHRWVVLGYNTGASPGPEFLMNMGWGGAPVWYTCDGSPYPTNQSQASRLAPEDMVKFVGDTNDGDGSPDDPYEDIQEALNEAPDNATLIFKASSINAFSGASLSIDGPFTLKGYYAILRGDLTRSGEALDTPPKHDPPAPDAGTPREYEQREDTLSPPSHQVQVR